MARPNPLPFRLAGVLAFLLSSSLAAQAAPARIADTLYALAADSTAYRDAEYVYLLDDGVIRLEADGRSSRTYRQVIWVLKESAVEQWSEFRFSHQPGRQKWTLNWARVVTSTGEVLTPAPDVSQESDVPASMDSPVYVDQKVHRLTLGRVKVGSIVDVSFTLEDVAPWRPGDFYSNWVVNPGLPVRRSRLVLDAPSGVEPRVDVKNLSFAPSVRDANGRRITTWATAEVPGFKAEPFAADSNGVIMRIDIGGASRWQEIGTWFAGLARDRFVATPALERKAAELVRGARTLEDSIEAVHRYVADEIRYVSVSLGIGGYQPRAAAEVLASGFGDCKDKAGLFIALLKPLGVKAYPVLLNNGGEVNRKLPSIAQFDHAIAAVDRPGRSRVYVDLTASKYPWGAIPGSVQGQFALVLTSDDAVEEVELPEEDGIASRILVRGTLDSAGRADVRAEMTVTGELATRFRVMVREGIDSAGRVAMMRQFAAEVYPESVGDSLAFTDTPEGVVVSVIARRGRAAQLAGPVAILAQPFQGNDVDLTGIIAELEAHRPRRFTIDAAAVSTSSNGALRYELTLPKGWQVQIPKDIELSGPFGVVRRKVRQQGNLLTIEQESRGGEGILPPSSLDHLLTWLRDLGAAAREGKNVVLMLPAATGR